MKISLITTLTLLIAGTCLQAQDRKPTRAGSTPGEIQGCLSSDLGTYSITDKDGKSTELTGAANKLGHLVGHEVLVTGENTIKTTDTTSWGTASTAVEHKVFAVKTVKDLGKACTQ